MRPIAEPRRSFGALALLVIAVLLSTAVATPSSAQTGNPTIHNLGAGPSDAARVDTMVRNFKTTGPLVGQGATIVAAAAKWNLDPLLLLGMWKTESQLGTDHGVNSGAAYNGGNVTWAAAQEVEKVTPGIYGCTEGAHLDSYVFAKCPTPQAGIQLWFDYVGSYYPPRGKSDLYAFTGLYNNCSYAGNAEGGHICGDRQAKAVVQFVGAPLGTPGAATQLPPLSNNPIPGQMPQALPNTGHGGAAADPIKFTENAPKWLALQIIHGLSGIVMMMLNGVLTFGEPNVGSEFFRGQYSITTQLALLLTVPFLLVATITAILKDGLKGLLTTYLVHLPLALLGGAAALFIVSLAQRIDQNFTDAFVVSARQNTNAFAQSIGNADALSSVGALGLYAIISIVLIFGTLFFAFEMVFRTMVIYMSTLFVPLAFATSVLPSTRRWLIALIELTLTAVFSKFIAVAVLSLGFAAVMASLDVNADTGDMGQLGTLVLGCVVLAVACLVLPGLIVFVMGPGTQIVGRQQGLNELPFTMERTASREYAVDISKGVGNLLSGGKGGG